MTNKERKLQKPGLNFKNPQLPTPYNQIIVRGAFRLEVNIMNVIIQLNKSSFSLSYSHLGDNLIIKLNEIFNDFTLAVMRRLFRLNGNFWPTVVVSFHGNGSY